MKRILVGFFVLATAPAGTAAAGTATSGTEDDVIAGEPAAAKEVLS